MKTPISWPEAQRICDIPEVREALDKFAVDACEENMLTMASTIMGHASAQGRALEPQGQALPVAEVFHYDGITYAELREPITVKPGDLLYASQLALPAGQEQNFKRKPTPEQVAQVRYKLAAAGFESAFPSQGALPAGPVPEGWHDDQMIRFAGSILIQGNRSESIAERLNEFRKLEVIRGNNSPAVAQPVADERAASDAYFKARHPMLDTATNRNVFSAGFRAALCQPAEEGKKS